MIRRLNFTGRKRLSSSDVTVRLSAGPGGATLVSATFALERYKLPPAARVFVEAYRQTTWQRFPYGTASAPVPAEPPVLRDFGSAQGVRFRVRVVEADASSEAPRVLALADGLKPVWAAGEKGGLSLLGVDWGDMQAHLWSLEFDEETGPLLRVSRRLVGERDREAFVGSREFASLVLPEVLRRVLLRALLEGGDEDDEDGGWASEWLRLARGWAGVPPPPERGESAEPSDDEEDWVEHAVEAFSLTHAIGDKFREWWEGSGA